MGKEKKRLKIHYYHPLNPIQSYPITQSHPTNQPRPEKKKKTAKLQNHPFKAS